MTESEDKIFKKLFMWSFIVAYIGGAAYWPWPLDLQGRIENALGLALAAATAAFFFAAWLMWLWRDTWVGRVLRSRR